MQPFLLFGGTSKQRKDWVNEVSEKNKWRLCEISKNNFESEVYKSSVTSSLNNKPIVFFLHNADFMSSSDLEKFIKLTEKTFHRFILSSKSLYKIPRPVRDKLHVIKIGDSSPDEFFDALNQIMINPNREKVREILEKEEKNIDSILHILKNNVWKTENKQAWFTVETCLNLMYKISSSFMISILAYNYPVCKIPISFEKKEKLNKEKIDIINKIKRVLIMNQKESLDLYYDILAISKSPNKQMAFDIAESLGFNDDERLFLGIEKLERLKPLEKKPNLCLDKWC